MQSTETAQIEKISKGVIKITFPQGTKAEVQSNVPIRELLDVLEGKSGLANQSTFPLNAPVPV
ncbi:hypothetical protein ACQ4WP_28330 [Janthinobacterium sp. GB4P2]|uniref:hypothetical protein n=1 Tax=Janthinobacterium sp. GB4P2 TaxID=3424189 RepID=UPI003F2677E4